MYRKSLIYDGWFYNFSILWCYENDTLSVTIILQILIFLLARNLCYKNRCENQWNTIKDPDMNPHSYAHLIFDKGTKKHGEKRASSTNVAGKSGYLPAEN
jgi:hypothetical protein